MTVSLGHHSFDGVATLANDVAVVGVGDVHLHGDPGAGAGVQHLGDHHLGLHHALPCPASHSDVRILLALSSDLQPVI